MYFAVFVCLLFIIIFLMNLCQHDLIHQFLWQVFILENKRQSNSLGQKNLQLFRHPKKVFLVLSLMILV